ncbi:MAG: DUF3578 domain-containing protein [Treponema sp.]|nr:DUF3578 domain-containing protein [Treponema sp.]
MKSNIMKIFSISPREIIGKSVNSAGAEELKEYFEGLKNIILTGKFIGNDQDATPSVGKGRCSKVPWVAIHFKSVKISSPDVRIGYLFNLSKRKAVLALMCGTHNEINEPLDRQETIRMRKDVQVKLDNYHDGYFKKNSDVVSEASAGAGVSENYDVAVCYYKLYDPNFLPDDAVLKDDLHKMCVLYRKYWEIK